MLLAAFLFLLASAGCGWAPNMPFFIAARAVSGMGGGGMTGLSFIIVADSFPLVFTKELTWRWCFWINLPIVGFTFIILLFFLRDPRNNHLSSTTVTSFFDKALPLLAAWANLFFYSVCFLSFLYYM
ncbi:MAG: hypothetical protein LQ352_001104 [Teloschistes flavicans]|nr:MAG: hypothetical protein LQ352_001104 [Teloschistes flavicans]